MQRNISPRQICWNEFLSCFDTDIHYIPGVSNSAADALSHVPHPTPSMPNQAGPDRKSSNNHLLPLDPALDTTPDDIIDAELYAMVATEVDSSVTDAMKAAYKNDKLFGAMQGQCRTFPVEILYKQSESTRLKIFIQ